MHFSITLAALAAMFLFGCTAMSTDANSLKGRQSAGLEADLKVDFHVFSDKYY
jgi:hypothetical protein